MICGRQACSPEISIIVPVYNASKYLNVCLNSIGNQEYEKFEVILINDGSTDASGRICDSYARSDVRFHVIHQENMGVSAARNAGLDCACGQYLCFVDADDFISTNYLEVLYQCCQIKNYDVSQSGVVGVYEDGSKHVLSAREPKKFIEIDHIIDGLLWGGAFEGGCWGKLFKTDTWGDTRFLNGISLAEDLAAVTTVFVRSCAIATCPSAVYYYRFQRNSLCHGKIKTKRLVEAFSADAAAADALMRSAPHRKKDAEWFKFSSDINNMLLSARAAVTGNGGSSILYQIFHQE